MSCRTVGWLGSFIIELVCLLRPLVELGQAIRDLFPCAVRDPNVHCGCGHLATVGPGDATSEGDLQAVGQGVVHRATAVFASVTELLLRTLVLDQVLLRAFTVHKLTRWVDNCLASASQVDTAGVAVAERGHCWFTGHLETAFTAVALVFSIRTLLLCGWRRCRCWCCFFFCRGFLCGGLGKLFGAHGLFESLTLEQGRKVRAKRRRERRFFVFVFCVCFVCAYPHLVCFGQGKLAKHRSRSLESDTLVRGNRRLFRSKTLSLSLHAHTTTSKQEQT